MSEKRDRSTDRVPLGKMCDCGNPAVVRRNNANICERCERIEARGIRKEQSRK